MPQQKSYWFRQGRRERSGRRNPGILAVDDEFELTAHECSKDGNVWSYSCKYRLTPKVKCPAKARVVLFDNKWILQTADNNHNCEPNKARVTAELLRHKMKNIVRANPAQSCGEAIRTVRIQADTEFGNDKDFHKHLVAELGTFAALEKQLLRVRHEEIGATIQRRVAFDPVHSLDMVHGHKDDLIVLELGDDWKDELDGPSSNSDFDFDWPKMNDNIQNIEEEFLHEGNENQEYGEVVEAEPETDEPSVAFHKRVLIFTSKELDNPDTYKHHKVCIKEPMPWKNKKCSSCKIGFNFKSDPMKCDGCDSFTHRKQACIREGSNKAELYCKTCIPTGTVDKRLEEPYESQTFILKVKNGFKCEKCSLIVKTKYSIRRHMERKHSRIESQNQSVISDIIETENLCSTVGRNEYKKNAVEKSNKEISSLNDVLEAIGLDEYRQLFEAEQIDLDMLLDLKQEEFLEMFRDIGIIPWGHKHKLRKAIDDLKERGSLDNMFHLVKNEH